MSDHELSAWADAYRQCRRPDATTVDRIRAGVERRGSEVPQPQRQRRSRWGLGFLVGIAAGLAVVFLADRLLPRPVQPAEPTNVPSQAPFEARDAAEGGEAKLRESAPSKRRVVPQAQPNPAVEPVAPTRKQPRSQPGKTLAPEPSGEALESLRLLRQAERKIESDPRAAIGMLREHRAKFPSSTMALERDALSIIAQCGIDPAAAANQRDRFLLQNPRSAYAGRVRRACK